MCGFIGKLSFNEFDEGEVFKANKYTECRGPDSKVVQNNKIENLNLTLIFNRLSILDLAENANQPLNSKKYKSSLMFNGEIFNHMSLRNDLTKKNVEFTTSHSDSEVVLNGLSYYGIDFIEKLRGQFAIFFHSTKKRKIYLVRDRLGQKPLFYSINNEDIVFGSNLLSVLKVKKNFDVSNSEAINYLNYGVIKSPNTLFKNIHKVRPGEIVEIDYSNKKFEQSSKLYWNIDDFKDTQEFELEKFHSLLSEAIELRMSADVPIANFLSGGLDSSSIIKNLHDNKISANTFSVYVDNEKYNEKKYIEEVVRKYQTNHSSIEISSKITSSEIFEGLDSLDEPYSDPSVIPSYLLSREISKKYKVAISGDGGDELLGGYSRVNQIINRKNKFENIYPKLYKIYPAVFGTGNKLLSRSGNIENAYRSYLEDEKLLNLFKVSSDKYDYANGLNNKEGLYKKLLSAEYKFYLSEMMMLKIDRTSMANSLEIRSPFVDHKLVEYIISTKPDYININLSKKILRDYLDPDLSKELIHRDKKGFVFDYEEWIYNNISTVSEIIDAGSIVKNLNKNILKLLSINKSRINSLRLWKLFTLENYLLNLNKI